MMTHSHPAVRSVLFGCGVLLILLTPPVALLPGPAGTFTFVLGAALVLRNSAWARRRWARTKRDWPRTGNLADRVMRRGSAKRRRERDRARRVD